MLSYFFSLLLLLLPCCMKWPHYDWQIKYNLINEGQLTVYVLGYCFVSSFSVERTEVDSIFLAWNSFTYSRIKERKCRLIFVKLRLLIMVLIEFNQDHFETFQLKSEMAKWIIANWGPCNLSFSISKMAFLERKKRRKKKRDALNWQPANLKYVKPHDKLRHKNRMI